MESGTPIILYGKLYTNYESRIDSVETFAVPKDASLYSKGNEVIVPASGETAEDIAIASSVRLPGVLLGGDLNVMTPCELLDPDFLAMGISNGWPHNQIAMRAQGKSVVHVHGVDIAEVEFAFPSLEEQSCISSAILDLDSLITLHQRKLDAPEGATRLLLGRMLV